MSMVFDPIVVGGLPLKNRATMAPMTRARSPGNVPTADNARDYAQRAGAGLMIGAGIIDMAAFDAAFTSNPDLVERMRHAGR